MKKWGIIVGSLIGVGAIAWLVTRGTGSSSEIEYRYATVQRGELILSTSSTGVLVPLTKVDVKSKAGGKIVKLLVEEGTPVVTGQTVALIDPEDTRATYQQAEADVTAAGARVVQARTNAQIESKNSVDRVRDAEIALDVAKSRLARVTQTTNSQPTLSRAELLSAQANVETAKEVLRTLEVIDVPRIKRDAQGQFDRAKADLDANTAELDRQENLLKLGYVAQNSVERQRSTLASSQATFNLAEQRMHTLDTEIDSQLRASRARLHSAEQSLAQARANQNKIPISRKDLDEARMSVHAAEVALSEARTQRLNVNLRQSEVQSAAASAVRSSVAMRNARIQLESTTVVAPRDGIVTLKYLEEGTIIPPGTSTFAQGTSLVQIADTTTMFVECSVDEADIGSVLIDQPVRIVIEAYPGKFFDGKVKKIFPAAESANALTTIKVRVQLLGEQKADAKGKKPILRPGMNASCEFIQMSKKNVLIVGQQSIKTENGKSTVRVKTKGSETPVTREVKVGISGNEGVEILEGLQEGEEVVIAEIDLRAMRDRQTKMDQAQQGGGFGSMNRGGPSQSRASGSGSSGGSTGSKSGR